MAATAGEKSGRQHDEAQAPGANGCALTKRCGLCHGIPSGGLRYS